jgi:multidrug efflux system outer membrane protein
MTKSEIRNPKSEIRNLLSVICLLLLSGCIVGPNYEQPKTKVPEKWSGSVGYLGTESADKVLVQWWTEFNDPNLTSLIQRAIQSNLNLKQAEERIRQARAQSGVVGAAFWPTVTANSSATRSRSVIPGNALNNSDGFIVNKSNTFKVGLDASWEMDIFGGTRRNIEAAQADIKAAVYDRRDVLVTLTSEVATNYINLRGYQQQIIIAQDNLKAQKGTADVTRQKFQGGFVSALDVANAEAQVATTLSQIPTLETSARQSIYSIAVLLGQQPESMLEELSLPSSIPVTPPEVPIGLPSEMLRRRPDIRKAEAQIHSATAQIGVAIADLFPKFSLTGNLSVSAANPGSLKWAGRNWSFGPSASWEIFNAGRVSANIEVQKALQEQSILTYQQTVLTALQDVENALVAYSNEHQRNAALIDSVMANRKAVELSTKLYTEGQTEFLNLLDAQRSLYSSEDALVQSNRNLSTNLIALYKALGGGWSPDDQIPQT